MTVVKFHLIVLLVLCVISPASFATENETNLSRLTQLVDENIDLLFVKSQANYQLGEHIGLELLVPEAGWLNILEVDANDKVSVLFPNQYAIDNHIASPGVFRIGGSCSRHTQVGCFKLVAKPPVGRSMVVAVWTRNALNLFDYVTSSNISDPFVGNTPDKQKINVAESKNRSILNRVGIFRKGKLRTTEKLMAYVYIDIF